MAKGIQALAGGNDRIDEGIGTISERSIAIGSRVIWLDNIGSLRIVRGARSYLLLVLGILVLIGSASMLGDNFVIALVGILAGVGLIAINMRQKVENGLSIGATDGRATLIVSKDEEFLSAFHDFLRLRINTGNVALEGQFDVKNNVFKSQGGGIVVGDRKLAGEIGRAAQAATFAPASSGPSMPDWASPESLSKAAEQATSAMAHASSAAAQATSAAAHAAAEVGSRVSGKAAAKLVVPVVSLLAVLLLGAGGYFAYQRFVIGGPAAPVDALPVEAPPVEAVTAPAPLPVEEVAPPAVPSVLVARASGLRYRAQPGATDDIAILAETRAGGEVLNVIETIAMPDGEWYKVRLADGREGYFKASLAVSSEQLEASLQRDPSLDVGKPFSAIAPNINSPAEGAVFSDMPRMFAASWSALPGAVSYIIEFEIFDPATQRWQPVPGRNGRLRDVQSQAVMLQFPAAQPGRWRVRGIDANGVESANSRWSAFSFSR